MNYIYGGKRFLKCEMGSEACFIDPSGDVLPYNGMETKISIGNIKEQTFDDIWNSEKADEVRRTVETCDKQCWMTGNAVPVMKKHILIPTKWVLKNKIRVLFGKEPELCFPAKSEEKGVIDNFSETFERHGK